MDNATIHSTEIPYELYKNNSISEDGTKFSINHTLYLKQDNVSIEHYLTYSLEEIQSLLLEVQNQEKKILSLVSEKAKDWEKYAVVKKLLLATEEYLKVPPVQHTNNQWMFVQDYKGVEEISNRVYKMVFHIYEHTKYNRDRKQSEIESWNLTWYLSTNSPYEKINSNFTIAEQRQKLFRKKDEMEKYIAGRKKAFSHYFIEPNPGVPEEYRKVFSIFNQLFPGYRLEEKSRN